MRVKLKTINSNWRLKCLDAVATERSGEAVGFVKGGGRVSQGLGFTAVGFSGFGAAGFAGSGFAALGFSVVTAAGFAGDGVRSGGFLEGRGSWRWVS